jgi:hypothetical protein
MNGTELILTLAVILFVAFALGWLAHWLFSRFSRVGQNDMGELDRLSHELHDAEEERDQAVAYLQQREAELFNQIAQTEAELEAAMDGLRAARTETEELRQHL